MQGENLDSLLAQVEDASLGLGALRGQSPEIGGVHDACRLDFDNGRCFLKTARAANAAMLKSERLNLEITRHCGKLRLPEPLLDGVAGERAFLLLEWLALENCDSKSAGALGTALARQHRCTAERHGWDQDNFIGLIAQQNTWTRNWTDFFIEHRLGAQLRIAEERFARDWVLHGLELLEHVPELLAGHEPVPSLLHGDLWVGNIAKLSDGTPVVFDPASHFGDRECDLAMSELFGSVPLAFYLAYNKEWPLDEGYESRKPLYQLYHIINHANMFGGGYETQAGRLIDALLARTTAGSLRQRRPYRLN